MAVTFMNPEPEDVAALIDDAKELIDRGWTRGTYFEDTDEGTKFCLRGALNEAYHAHGYYLLLPAVREVQKTIAEKLNLNTDPNNIGITVFNDTRKTKEPVIDVLSETSKRLRNPEVV